MLKQLVIHSIQVVNNEAEMGAVLELMSWVKMWLMTTMITFSTDDTHQIPFLYLITSDLQPLPAFYCCIMSDSC